MPQKGFNKMRMEASLLDGFSRPPPIVPTSGAGKVMSLDVPMPMFAFPRSWFGAYTHTESNVMATKALVNFFELTGVRASALSAGVGVGSSVFVVRIGSSVVKISARSTRIRLEAGTLWATNEVGAEGSDAGGCEDMGLLIGKPSFTKKSSSSSASSFMEDEADDIPAPSLLLVLVVLVIRTSSESSSQTPAFLASGSSCPR